MMKLILVIAALIAVAAAQDSFCKTTLKSGGTVDLSPIKQATYTGPLIGAAGLSSSNATVNFGWCGTTFNSTTCDSTGNVMTIEADGSCVSAFGAINSPLAPMQNFVQLILFGAVSGALAQINVMCDKNGAQGTATLEGTIVNLPIYQYVLQFSSVHACPTQ